MRSTGIMLKKSRHQFYVLMFSLVVMLTGYSQSGAAPLNGTLVAGFQDDKSNILKVDQRSFSISRQQRVHRPRGSHSKGDDVHYPRGSRRPHHRPHRRPKAKFKFVVPLIQLGDEGRPAVKRRKPRPRVTKKPRRRIRWPAPLKIADKRYRRKQVVIVIKQAKSQRHHRRIARKYGLRLLRGRYYNILKARVQVYRIPDRRSVGIVLAQLKRERRVSASQPNYVYSLTGKESSKAGELQYSHRSMRVSQAHEHSLGRKIKIAVIDTGIDRAHPEFRAASITQYNAVKPKARYKGHKHGTAIAGIMAAQEEVKGIAPMAHILDARAFYISKKGNAETDSMILVEALQWSYDKGARIFNMSFEGPKDPVIEDAIQAIYEKGRIFVGAAGNGGPKAKPAYPAAYKYVIATTAIDKKNRRYQQANRGPYVSVSAPGVKVMVLSTSNSYSFESGTSIATAHISGLVALMLEKKPKMSGLQIRKILTKTARDLGKPGPDVDYGAGLADAYSSLQAVQEISLSKR